MPVTLTFTTESLTRSTTSATDECGGESSLCSRTTVGSVDVWGSLSAAPESSRETSSEHADMATAVTRARMKARVRMVSGYVKRPAKCLRNRELLAESH